MKKNTSVILFYVVIFALIILAATQLMNKKAAVPLTYKDVETYFEKDLVKSFEVKNDGILVMQVYIPEGDENGGIKRDADGKITNATEERKFQLSSLSLALFAEGIREYTKNNQNLESYNYEPDVKLPWWVTFLPPLLIGVILIALWVFTMNRMSGKGGKIGTFSKAKARMPVPDEKNKVTFADVAGADEEKAELEEIVEFLKSPAKFAKLGAKIPHGVLLVGPPGTGKTLLAKAVAGEAGVPFFSISGSDFVELYVGVGASRVRELFENARKAPASIIFIDEIDAVGRHRGAGLGGGHDEREQTLNQLLVEMDGFGPNEGIIVMAATNRPDILDPALLRPGRFDRHVTINYPDIHGREAILKVHAKGKPFELSVDFQKVAQMTVGFTGADLANLLNESSLLAVKRNKSLIGMEEIEDSFMKILLGPKKHGRVRTEKDNKLAAYHEAGHAVSSFYCKHTDPVKVITIVPTASAGGVTVSFPAEDTMCQTRNQMFESIVTALGGRVAEELVMEDISTGASNDIQQATKTAHNMITRYGMSEKLGTVLYGSRHPEEEVFLGRDLTSEKNYSEKTAAEIDDEIRTIIATAYDRCRKILSEHMDKLHFIAGFLLKYESMDADQFKAAMESDTITYEDLTAIAEEKRRKSREDNERRNIELEKQARLEAEMQAAAQTSEQTSEQASEEETAESGADENASCEATSDEVTSCEVTSCEATSDETTSDKVTSCEATSCDVTPDQTDARKEDADTDTGENAKARDKTKEK